MALLDLGQLAGVGADPYTQGMGFLGNRICLANLEPILVFGSQDDVQRASVDGTMSSARPTSRI